MGDFEMAWFPWDERNGGAGGSLVYQKDFYKPSLDSGPLIYFTSEDCTTELERVKECGGKVLFERRLIAPNIGFMGVFVDSEGNRIALHSTK